MKKRYNRLKEKKITKQLMEIQPLKFYLVCCYEDDEESCYDEMQVGNLEFAKAYIGHNGFKVFAVYEDGLMEELWN
jgi:hypothetical protein